jgi:tetratricopeptide (TPR) repeat protein
VAAARGDTAARAEAYQALAAATASGAVAAALHEDLAWLEALVLEDFDRASASFAEAARVDPTARGPLLGGLLVAARRNDPTGLAAATAALAESTTQADAAAALHLRASALTTALGEDTTAAAGLPPAVSSVARARAIAPDDVGALVVAAERAAMPAPPPAGSPEEVAFAVDQLLARAEVFALRAQLADDPVARASWELDRADALEAAGRLKEAGGVVAGVLRTLPNDLRALEALRRLARRGGDRTTLGRATLALARRMTDPTVRVELLREAVAIFDPNVAGADSPGVDAEAAVAVYKRILGDDPGAPEFERLVALYRGAGDLRGLHLAIDERLTWIDRGQGVDPQTAVPLLLERARLRKGLGNTRGAAADLEDLLRRDPRHAEALRQSAELAAAVGDAPRAVELWRRYLEVERDPGGRSAAELALARVLAEDMGDTAGAIAELERVIAAHPDDAHLRERLIGLATRSSDWNRVARELRELARLRTSSGDRAREELRLAEIQRDKLNDRVAARVTLVRARNHDPFNLEILEPLVALSAAGGQRDELLAQVASELRDAIEQAPARAAFYERLAAVAGWQHDRDAIYWTSLAVEAVGTPTTDHRQAINDGRKSLPPLPRARIDRAQVRPAAAAGPVAELWRAIAPAVTASVGLDPGKLGFARQDKVALKNLGKQHADALGAALAAFGVEEAEIYISAQRNGMARVLSGEQPIVCVGADVAAGATAAARYWLGRAAILAAEGTGTLAELKDAEVAWWLAAGARAAEAPVPPGLADVAASEANAVADRTRLLQKHLSRRDKKTLAGLGAQLGQIAQPADVTAWRRAALSAAQRAGVLLAGDLAPALAVLDVRGARAIADSPLAADAVAWSVSEAHLALRKQLLGGQR